MSTQSNNNAAATKEERRARNRTRDKIEAPEPYLYLQEVPFHKESNNKKSHKLAEAILGLLLVISIPLGMVAISTWFFQSFTAALPSGSLSLGLGIISYFLLKWLEKERNIISKPGITVSSLKNPNNN